LHLSLMIIYCTLLLCLICCLIGCYMLLLREMTKEEMEKELEEEDLLLEKDNQSEEDERTQAFESAEFGVDDDNETFDFEYDVENANQQDLPYDDDDVEHRDRQMLYDDDDDDAEYYNDDPLDPNYTNEFEGNRDPLAPHINKIAPMAPTVPVPWQPILSLPVKSEGDDGTLREDSVRDDRQVPWEPIVSLPVKSQGEDDTLQDHSVRDERQPQEVLLDNDGDKSHVDNEEHDEGEAVDEAKDEGEDYRAAQSDDNTNTTQENEEERGDGIVKHEEDNTEENNRNVEGVRKEEQEDRYREDPGGMHAGGPTVLACGPFAQPEGFLDASNGEHVSEEGSSKGELEEKNVEKWDDEDKQQSGDTDHGWEDIGDENEEDDHGWEDADDESDEEDDDDEEKRTLV